MKKLLVLFCLSLAVGSYAQNFEGTLKWTIQTEITDPETKAKLEKAQKEMADPANQAKMKQMQEQMNSPQMKAMMEQNPQMKAQMENALKMMQSGDATSFLPKAFTVKTSGNNSITHMEGGMMPMEILALGDKKETYLLDRNAKTYAVIPADKSTTTSQNTPKPKVTKTSETMKILNYTCTKYLVEVTEHGKTINQIFWTTTEIKGLDMKRLSEQHSGKGNQSFYYEGIDGVPLKMELSTKEANMVMTMTELKKEKIPASEFTIPAGFKETQLPFSSFVK